MQSKKSKMSSAAEARFGRQYGNLLTISYLDSLEEESSPPTIGPKMAPIPYTTGR